MEKVFTCHWIDAHGNQNSEGTFTLKEETQGQLKLERAGVHEKAVFPDMVEISLPKEGYNTATNFIRNPQYWQDAIQVHLGNFAYPFIFEPIK